jgi:hypothetical protein
MRRVWRVLIQIVNPYIVNRLFYSRLLSRLPLPVPLGTIKWFTSRIALHGVMHGCGKMESGYRGFD